MTDKGYKRKYEKRYETAGHPRSFETPADWLDAVNSYFDYCDKNPILKVEALKSGDRAGELIYIPVQRPYLIEGLCDFLGIPMQTFYNYEKKEGYDKYFEITAYARNKIFSQNLQMGLVGCFDSALVARKLGLADRQEMKAELANVNAIVVSVDGNVLQASNIKVTQPALQNESESSKILDK